MRATLHTSALLEAKKAIFNRLAAVPSVGDSVFASVRASRRLCATYRPEALHSTFGRKRGQFVAIASEVVHLRTVGGRIKFGKLAAVRLTLAAGRLDRSVDDLRRIPSGLDKCATTASCISTDGR